jgi:hypothetical protein
MFMGERMKENKLIVGDKIVNDLNQWKLDNSSGLYRPYLTVRKVNKVGRRHWMFCSKQNREVHLLSDGERRAYTILLWLPGTITVMEQYALDIDETIEIAEELGFVHPRNHNKNEAHVMSTDFVVQKLDSLSSAVKTIAYTFKYSDQIFDEIDGNQKTKSYRTWQKFSIEKKYWNNRGIEYRVITEKDATKERFWNIQFCLNAAAIEIQQRQLQLFINTFESYWCVAHQSSLQRLINKTAVKMNLDDKYVLNLFKYAVIHQILLIENNYCIRNFRPIMLTCKWPSQNPSLEA